MRNSRSRRTRQREKGFAVSADVRELDGVRKADATALVDRTRLSTVALQVGAASYVLAGFLLAVFFFSGETSSAPGSANRVGIIWFLVTVFTLLLVIGVLSLIVARALRRRKRWAWRTALVLFISLFLTTILLPVGIVGLYGLLSAGTRARFRAAQERGSRIY